MRISWKVMKKFLDDTKLYRNLNYMFDDTEYYLWINYEGEKFFTTILQNSVDANEFLAIYAPQTVVKNDISEDGKRSSEVLNKTRNKYLQEHSLYFTSTVGSQDSFCDFFTFVKYNAEGNIAQEGEEIHKCVAIFEPPYDYDVIGGAVEILDFKNREEIKDVFVNAIGNPYIPREYGGSVPIMINRKFLYARIEIGGGYLMPLRFIPDMHTNMILIEVDLLNGIVKDFQIVLRILTY